MTQDVDVTVVTERGQVSVPASLRRSLGLEPGVKLAWERFGDRRMLVRVVDERPAPGAKAMLGFAKRFRPVRRSDELLAELREGER